jgi:hypothetical protein
VPPGQLGETGLAGHHYGPQGGQPLRKSLFEEQGVEGGEEQHVGRAMLLDEALQLAQVPLQVLAGEEQGPALAESPEDARYRAVEGEGGE